MKAGHFGGDFKTVLAAIAVGAVFLTVIAVVMGCAAAKTGMTFGQLINCSKIIGFLLAFSAWFPP